MKSDVSPTRRLPPRVAIALLGGLLVAGILLRLGGLGRRELWFDECFSVFVTQLPVSTWEALRSQTFDGSNPPLYFLLLEPWMALFGTSAPGVRSFSFLWGVLGMGALGANAWALGLGRRSMVLAVALGAVAVLPVYYSMEARAYSMLVFLLGMAMVFFFLGLRGWGPWTWVGHGLSLSLALYTHVLAVPFAAAFWLAMAWVRPEARVWKRLALTHLAVGVVYLPWLPVLLGQTGTDVHDWTRHWWEQTPQVLMIPRSLEVFGIAPRLPEYLPYAPPGTGARLLGIGLLAVAVPAGVLSLLRNRPAEDSRAMGSLHRRRVLGLLAIFLFTPLLFLVAYSNLKTPLYLIGRYDLPAQTAFLLLVAAGLDSLAASAGKRSGVALAGLLALVLGLGGWVHRERILHPSLDDPRGPWAQRAAILHRYASEEDVVVGVGLTRVPLEVALERVGLGLRVESFPFSQNEQAGTINARKVAEEGEENGRRDAREIVDWIETRPPRHRALWVVIPEAALDAEATMTITGWLLREVRSRRCRLLNPSGEREAWQALGLYAFGPPGSPKLRSLREPE